VVVVLLPADDVIEGVGLVGGRGSVLGADLVLEVLAGFVEGPGGGPVAVTLLEEAAELVELGPVEFGVERGVSVGGVSASSAWSWWMAWS
jgi:hypothetical protein